MDASNLEARLHSQIPVSRFMEVRVVSADNAGVELRAGLKPNHNHLGTVFGGSLSSLMILAAYCVIFQLIEDDGHVLLKSSACEFSAPVDEDPRATCARPDAKSVEAFLRAYRKKGKARLHLNSEIRLSDGREAARLSAEFVGVG